MPHPANQSDANTLPDPELNPLLNPLLAAHMGRWAEVYFTNPPEKRGEAVAELIRELESLPAPEPGSIPAINTDIANPQTETTELSAPSYAVEPLCACGGCGYENSAEQKFCGMCGAPLQASPRVQIPHAGEISQIPWAGLSEPEHFLGGSPGDSTIEPAVSVAAGGIHEAQESAWTPVEEELPHFVLEPEPVPSRYRLYVGAALVILLVLLVYMGWRGAKAFSGAAGPQSVPGKVIPPTSAPASAAQPSATPSGSSDGKLVNKPLKENPPASAVRSRSQQEATPQKKQTAAHAASRIAPAPITSPSPARESNGAEELATAENYLNGTQGVTRDRGEAARWLWKAVRKDNAAAALALSDLYLRGDGEPKDCEQARVLLDAAARKGARAAAERLRNLQAFGCQ